MHRSYQYALLLVVTATSTIQGQYYYYNDAYYHNSTLVETGLSAGAMNCLTDLGGNKGKGTSFMKDFNAGNTKACFGIYVSVLYEQMLGARLEGSLGRIEARDDILKNDPSEAKDRYHRNLHFASSISEGSLVAELFPLSLIKKNDYPLLSPYMLAGVGFFKFNPRAELKGRWYDLHPLHTEGQGFRGHSKKAYKLMQLNFPVGLGVRYELSALLIARLEVMYRILQTDYLDDVSTRYIDPSAFYLNLPIQEAMIAQQLADRGWELQPGLSRQQGEIRGNPGKNDTYFSFSLKIGLVLNRKKR